MNPITNIPYEYNFDEASLNYKKIFSDTSIPFSERLDKAVELANQLVKNKMRVAEIFRLFYSTGCIFVSSPINPNQTT